MTATIQTEPIRTATARLLRGAMLLGLLGLGLTACDKTIDAPEAPALQPISNDPTGGTWKPIVIPSDSVPSVAAPDATAYAAELAEVKTLQSTLTSAMKSDIAYWSAGGVLRWNEIVRGLVTRYNVAPPVGAPINPLKPFANPPFASRAYALLSVAQYDALVAVWKAQPQFNRQAPYKVDAGIMQLAPVADMPSFPSEHAAIAAVSEEVLRFLFPGDSAYLAGRAANERESRIWAGANVRGEIRAGDSIGRAVAQRVIARAKTDGAKNARGGDTLFTDRTKWVSLEIPARPPMLPLWGKVKTWVTPSLDVVRPAPPPAVGSAEFQKALDEVRSYSDSRTREQWRIADLWADGAGTTTPPGHWNAITADLIRNARMSELRCARTFALLNMAMMDAGIACWDAKYLWVVPRPSQLDPNIRTATGVPNFPSYTSGHSSFSAAAAEVLAYVFPAVAGKVRADAEEAAISRLYGCIHYRFDNEAGTECGRKVGQFAVDFGKADGSPAN